MQSHPLRLAALCTATMLAACGGGGSAHDTPSQNTWQSGVLQGPPVLTVSLTAAQLKAQLQAGPTRDQALLDFCDSLPWIGGITKYHLAKNFGAQVAKPDVHLVRLAEREGCAPQQLCERLAAATGWRVITVDTLLWRACANGFIDSRTGEIKEG